MDANRWCCVHAHTPDYTLASLIIFGWAPPIVDFDRTSQRVDVK